MSRALVLNATFEPLCVVADRRALVLVLAQKAAAVEQTDRVARSEHRIEPMPSVVRLIRYVRVPRRAAVPLTRRAVFARDGGRCVYCDLTGDEPRSCRPAKPRGAARVGERRLGLSSVQPPQG